MDRACHTCFNYCRCCCANYPGLSLSDFIHVGWHHFTLPRQRLFPLLGRLCVVYFIYRVYVSPRRADSRLLTKSWVLAWRLSLAFVYQVFCLTPKYLYRPCSYRLYQLTPPGQLPSTAVPQKIRILRLRAKRHSLAPRDLCLAAFPSINDSKDLIIIFSVPFSYPLALKFIILVTATLIRPSTPPLALRLQRR